MSLQDWTNIATIFGAIGTFAVGIAALLVSVAARRAQRESLPVSVKFLVRGVKHPLGNGGVCLMNVELKNTGVRAYVHYVYLADCWPKDLLKERAVTVLNSTKHDSLPGHLKSMNKRKLLRFRGLFASQYVLPGQYLKLVLLMPSELREIKLTAAVSVRRGDSVRLLSSDHMEV